MANRWRKVETVTDLIFLGSKITADGDWSHEIKRRLLLGRKAMTKQDSILKSTDITLLTKIHIFQATLFPAVMYRCESWTIKMWELDQLSAKELKLLNCGAGEDSWESLGQKGDPNSQSKRKPTLNIHWRDWRWSWSSKTWATWC